MQIEALVHVQEDKIVYYSLETSSKIKQAYKVNLRHLHGEDTCTCAAFRIKKSSCSHLDVLSRGGWDRSLMSKTGRVFEHGDLGAVLFEGGVHTSVRIPQMPIDVSLWMVVTAIEGDKVESIRELRDGKPVTYTRLHAELFEAFSQAISLTNPTVTGLAMPDSYPTTTAEADDTGIATTTAKPAATPTATPPPKVAAKPTVSVPAWKKIARPTDFAVDQDIWEALMCCASQGRTAILLGPTGCHPKGTEIIRASGKFVPVESVQIGDTLKGDDGTNRTVLNLIHGKGLMYKIVPTNGKPFGCNEDHILSLVRTDTGEIKDVRLADYLSWSKTQKHLYKLFRSEEVSFGPENEWLPVNPYFMGVVLGDGSITKVIRVAVESQNTPIIDACEEVAKTWGLTVTRCSGRNKLLDLHLVGSKNRTNHLTEMFKDFQLLGTNSGTKFVPDAYKFGSIETRKQVLAGLVDTDGHVAGGCLDFIFKSKRLAEDTAFIGRSLGLHAFVREKESYDQHGNGGTYHRVSLSGDIAKLPIRLVYKKPAARAQKKNVLRTGFKVVEAGIGEYFGFTLDGNGRYLLDDFTVTHNSGKTDLIYRVSSALGVTMEPFNFGAMSEPRISLIGATHFKKEEGTLFNESRFIKAIRKEDGVVLFDEMTRANRDAFNLIFSLLDGQRYLALDESEAASVVYAGKSVAFMATANVGFEYTGTDALDRALFDRFQMKIELDYPKAAQEHDVVIRRFPDVSKVLVKKLVETAEQQRQMSKQGDFETSISTRMVLDAAKAIVDGMDPKSAIKFAILGCFSSNGGVDSERVKVVSLFQKRASELV